MTVNGNQSLDQVLESAVVLSWADLMHGTETGLIHIEYGFAPGGTLDHLQVWSSLTPGHWLLACAYWMSPSAVHSTGVNFENGYQSEGLAHILGFIMQHQDAFALPLNLGRRGLLQITTPTTEENKAAAASIAQAFNRLGATFAEPAAA
jgi:hypothetical protein